MTNGRDGALHNKYIRARVLRELAELSRALRNGTDRGQCPAVFDLANARGN